MGAAAAHAQDKSKAEAAAFNTKDCYECHEAVQEFHEKGTHKSVACDSCHTGLDAHRKAGKGRPTNSTDPASCGSCHQNQFRTMYNMNTEKTAHKEKGVGPQAAPLTSC